MNEKDSLKHHEKAAKGTSEHNSLEHTTWQKPAKTTESADLLAQKAVQHFVGDYVNGKTNIQPQTLNLWIADELLQDPHYFKDNLKSHILDLSNSDKKSLSTSESKNSLVGNALLEMYKEHLKVSSELEVDRYRQLSGFPPPIQKKPGIFRQMI